MNLTTLIADVSRQVRDKGNRYLNSTIDLPRLINQAQDQWALDTEAKERMTGMNTQSGVALITPPADFIRPKGIWYQDFFLTEPTGILDFGSSLGFYNFPGFPQQYALWDGKIRLLPAPSANPTTVTLSAALGAGDSAAFINSLALRSNGIGTIDAEIFEWFGSTGGSNPSINNLARGVGGTQAGSHSVGATLTQYDLRMCYFARPATLVNGGDVSEVPDRYSHLLADLATSFYFGDANDTTNEVKFRKRYEEAIQNMRAIARQKQRQRAPRTVDSDKAGGGNLWS